MFKSENTEVLIVGQGLAGTMLSYHLFKEKIAHKVIDVAKEGSASRAAAGLINPIVVKRVCKTWRADEFHPYAHTIYQELEILLKTRFYYPMRISKLYGSEDEHFWQQQMEKEQLQKHIAVNAKYDLPSGMIQKYGYGTIKLGARLDMATMLDAYRQFLIENEMLIEDDFNEDDLSLTQSGLNWKTITAKRIVFCRGSFDADSAFFKHLKWNNTKGELLDVTINGLELDNVVSKGVFVMPVGKEQFKIGATYTHKWDDLEPTPAKLDELINKWQVISSLPLIINKQITGIRPTLADRRPVMMFLENLPQVGIFNGLGSRGGLMVPLLAHQFVGQL